MKTLLFAVFISLFSTIFSQQVEIEWLNRMGSSKFDMIKDVAVTNAGDVISFGYFTGTVDFDPSSGVYELTSYDSLPDLFIQKTSANGNVIWTKQFAGVAQEFARKVIIDDFDNIYLTITYPDSLDADPGPGIELLTSPQNYNMALIKLTSSGELDWVKNFESQFSMWADEMIIDNNGDLLLTGKFSGEVRIDPNNPQLILPSGINGSIFILKLDINGNFQWVKAFDGGSSDLGNDVAVDTLNNIYITGIVNEYSSFVSTNTIEFAQGVFISSSDESKGYILKMDSTGTPLWVIESGNAGHQIELGNDGNLIVMGEFEGDVDFDPSSSTLILSSETRATFVQEITPNGDVLWAKSYPVLGESMILDQNDNIYFTGRYEGTAEFTNPAFNMTAHDYTDICILRLDDNGDVIWTRTMGSTSEDRGYDLALSNDDMLYVGGYFSLLCAFGPGAGTFEAIGEEDAFLLKLNTFVSLEEPSLTAMGIYPNPSSGIFQLKQNEYTSWDVIVQDIHGKILMSETFDGLSFELDLRSFADGVYFVSGVNDSERFSERVVKEGH